MQRDGVTQHYCGHRRQRRTLWASFTVALSLIALGYGVIRGTAIGHADALQTQVATCQVEATG